VHGDAQQNNGKYWSIAGNLHKVLGVGSIGDSSFLKIPYISLNFFDRALRQDVFELSKVTAAEEARGEKSQVMFNFLTSQEYFHTIGQIFGPILGMQNQLDKEKGAIKRSWKEQTALIESSISGAETLCMKIRGIAQVNLPTVKGMETLEDLTEL